MGRAQAQATAQRTQAITNQDSFQLVKCLIRVSVYHVCWMRGLFPEGSFTGHDLAQLDHLHVKMLEPNQEDDEATTLKNWVEQGVVDAVSKGYLKNMYFGIAQDAAATNLLEEYIYSFKYGADGVEFEMAAHAGKKKDKYNSKGKERARPGLDDVRYQVVRLMRMLVQLCQTLDKVPEERYLFIKLTYHDHAPEEYEPPFFHGVAEDGIGHFHRRPFSMDVGCMDTHHHMVSVRVKSVLDSCDDDDGQEDEALMELQASQQLIAAAGDEEMAEPAGDEAEGMNDPASQEDAGTAVDDEGAASPALAAAATDMSPSTEAAAAAAVAGSARLRTEEAMALLTATEDPNTMLMDTDAPQAQDGHPQRPTDSATDDTCLSGDQQKENQGQVMSGGLEPCVSGEASGGGSGQVAYESVRTYCLGRQLVTYMDLLATFYNLTEAQLHKVLDGLQREGLIKAGSKDKTWVVLQPGTAAAAAGGLRHPTTSEGIMAEAPGAGSGGSVAQHNTHSNRQQGQLRDEDQLLTSKMSGLSVGAAATGGGAAAQKARGMAGLDASVYGAAMRAGSLMTGQPGAPTAAPTATHPQVNPTAAGDEPSVQLLQDQQQALWFDASQQSFQGPNAARTAAGDGNAAAAAGEAQTGRTSRLRKASYVNNPIYQHAGKRGPGSSLHQQQQEEEDKENAGAEVEQHGPPAEARGVQQQQQGVAADTAAMQPPRKKVAAVRKPKKPAATALADGTPTRAGGRAR